MIDISLSSSSSSSPCSLLESWVLKSATRGIRWAFSIAGIFGFVRLAFPWSCDDHVLCHLVQLSTSSYSRPICSSRLHSIPFDPSPILSRSPWLQYTSLLPFSLLQWNVAPCIHFWNPNWASVMWLHVMLDFTRQRHFCAFLPTQHRYLEGNYLWLIIRGIMKICSPKISRK